MNPADRELERFLQQVVLDPALRDLARRDPDAAFEGFHLDEADRDVLRRQDPDALALLGRVLRARFQSRPALQTLGPLTLDAPPAPAPPEDPGELAAAIRSAPPERRYDLIVELVHALGRARTGRAGQARSAPASSTRKPCPEES